MFHFSVTQRKGCTEILQSLNYSDLFALKDTVANKQDVWNKEGAISVILSHSQSAEELLKRRKVVREAILKYLIKHDVVISASSDKQQLINKALVYWIYQEWKRNESTDQKKCQLLGQVRKQDLEQKVTQEIENTKVEAMVQEVKAARRELEQARQTEEQLRGQVEEQTRKRVEERTKRRAEEQLRKQMEEQMKRRAEEQLRKQMEEQTKRRAEEQLRKQVEEQTKRRAEEQLRKQMEEQTKRRAEEQLRKQMEEQMKRRAEEQLRKQMEEQMKRRAEEQLRKQVEEQTKRQAEEQLKKQMEEQTKRRAEEQRRKQMEEQARKEEEEQIRRAEEQAGRELEEQIKRQVQEQMMKQEQDEAKRQLGIQMNIHLNVTQYQVPPQTATGGDFDCQIIGEAFCQWFFVLLNSQNPSFGRQPEEWGPQHFWDDAVFHFAYSVHEDQRQQYQSSELVSQRLLYLVKDEQLLFNPNISMNGMRCATSPHGIVAIAVAGTIHQNSQCLGIFEQLFGLIRTPVGGNNWKIKYVNLQVKALNGQQEIIQPSLSIELPALQAHLNELSVFLM